MKKHVIGILLLIGIITACVSNPKTTIVENHKDGRPLPSEIMAEMDQNKDGKLSISEVKGPLQGDFNQIDINHDGFLSMQELEQFSLSTQGDRNNPGPNQQVNLLSEIDPSVRTTKLDTSHLILENVLGVIAEKTFVLNGVETPCYVIKTHSLATEHQMGPWCPKHIEDGAEKSGIWFENGNVYDASGHFIAELDEFYNDDNWMIYREDGTIRVTNTKEGCLAAAKPNVEEAYQNYCVECLPEYFADQTTTFVIPVSPIYVKKSHSFGRGGIGIALNGVKFDPPAPTHAILAAHTIAPLDDHGGHVNPHGGYHYHAVTGSNKEIEQNDDHSPLIGYAIDGFGIYALEDKKGHQPTDLDECGGHFDTIRGYHYHAGSPGGNQIIKCLHGIAGFTEVEE